MSNRRAFTLIEVIVILAVIGILAGLAVPAALRIFQVTAEETTREEMDNIKRAILGDARKLQSSFRSDFGYLGDMGCLPATAVGGLDRLLTQGSLPAWSFDSAKQAGAGWKGPYITGTPGEDFTTDQWGNPYTYTPDAVPCPLTATLISNGPNGVFESGAGDDITLTIVANETTATVRGTVKDAAGVGIASTSVEFYSAANNGVLTTTTAVTDANGNYEFVLAPFGPRAVKASSGTLTLVPNSVSVSGGSNNNVDFQVRNDSANAFNVTAITVTCVAPAVRLADVLFDNTNVENPNLDNRPCGTLMTLSNHPNTFFSANPTPSAPLRVFVDSPDTLLPDLVVKGSGQTRTISLDDFENAGGGNPNQDMRNTTLTVTFTLSVGGPVSITFDT